MVLWLALGTESNDDDDERSQRRRKVPKSVWDESSAEGARGESPKAARGLGCGEGVPPPHRNF